MARPLTCEDWRELCADDGQPITRKMINQSNRIGVGTSKRLGC